MRGQSSAASGTPSRSASGSTVSDAGTCAVRRDGSLLATPIDASWRPGASPAALARIETSIRPPGATVPESGVMVRNDAPPLESANMSGRPPRLSSVSVRVRLVPSGIAVARVAGSQSRRAGRSDGHGTEVDPVRRIAARVAQPETVLVDEAGRAHGRAVLEHHRDDAVGRRGEKRRAGDREAAGGRDAVGADPADAADPG